MAHMVRVSACSAPVLLPGAVPSQRWRTAAFRGFGHSRKRPVERIQCYREEGGSSGGASSKDEQQSG